MIDEKKVAELRDYFEQSPNTTWYDGVSPLDILDTISALFKVLRAAQKITLEAEYIGGIKTEQWNDLERTIAPFSEKDKS